jgi:hypothetical protein
MRTPVIFRLSLNEQYDRSYPLRWPHLTAEQREKTALLFDEYEAAVRDYHALAAQAQQARDHDRSISRCYFGYRAVQLAKVQQSPVSHGHIQPLL